MSGTAIGRGNLRGTNIYTLTLSPTSIPPTCTNEQTFTFAGLGTVDFVYVIKPTNQVGIGIVNCRVSAANTLAISFMNVSTVTITPTAAELYTLHHLISEYNPLQTVA
jgi:hypothetical protein